MQDEVVVSREMLKAIGGETRVRILKALKQRQKTQSELASELGLAAPTVLEHMKGLEKAGLIERVPEDRERKWKYYRLTRTAEGMVGKRRMNVILVLAHTSLALTIGLALFYLLIPAIIDSLLTGGATTAYEPPPPADTAGSGQISGALSSLQASAMSFCGGVVLLGILLTLLLYSAALWRPRENG